MVLLELPHSMAAGALEGVECASLKARMQRYGVTSTVFSRFHGHGVYPGAGIGDRTSAPS